MLRGVSARACLAVALGLLPARRRSRPSPRPAHRRARPRAPPRACRWSSCRAAPGAAPARAGTSRSCSTSPRARCIPRASTSTATGPTGRTDPALVAAFRPTGFAGPALAKRMQNEFDFEDTILAAELEAASVLATRVAGPRLRTGLSDSRTARTCSPRSAARPPRSSARSRSCARTSASTCAARTTPPRSRPRMHMLVPEPEAADPGRQRAIVFLSDGAPSLPVFCGDHGRSEALLAARDAGLAGIRLFAFAFGEEGAAGHRGARADGGVDGRPLAARRAARAAGDGAARAATWWTWRASRSTTTTTGLPARAVRLFPDGSFDALLTLAEGENVLRVEAFASDGSGVYLERRVRRLPGTAEADEAARGRELLAKLRQRTAEMEAWAEVERRRQEQRRSPHASKPRAERPGPAARSRKARPAAPRPVVACAAIPGGDAHVQRDRRRGGCRVSAHGRCRERRAREVGPGARHEVRRGARPSRPTT